MRFAHIADTHIRNLKYHFEYREVFKQLYKSLKEEKVDYIFDQYAYNSRRAKILSRISEFHAQHQIKLKRVLDYI